MADYSLQVNVSEECIQQLTEQQQYGQFRYLSFAFGVAPREDAEPEYNVLAATCGKSNSFIHTDTFLISE